MAVKLNAGETMRDRERVALVILDQISQFTALLDTDGRVLEVNRAALERGGLDREKVLGRPFWEEGWWGSGQDDAARLRTAIGAAAAGDGVHHNLTMVDAGGSGEIEFSLTPVKDESGRVEYVLVEGRNIAPTEHARAEPTPNLVEARVGFESPKLEPNTAASRRHFLRKSSPRARHLSVPWLRLCRSSSGPHGPMG